MHVSIETTEKKLRRLELGDVIVADGTSYLVAKFGSTYVARNFNGLTGLCGIRDSLEELTDSIPATATVYPKDLYQLVLRDI